MTDFLTFGKGNAKLGKDVATFSLPAGKSCPFAHDCKASVKLVDGRRKLVDGKDATFRCFAASQEVFYKNTFESRARNLSLLRKARSVKKMAVLISESLPRKARKVRIHVSGDFFSKAYLYAWVHVAHSRPEVAFYGYTKSLPYVAALRGTFPPNFTLVASEGGKRDDLIRELGMRSARVFTSPDQIDRPIDHDDSLARDPTAGDFGLLLHGVQPAGRGFARLSAYSRSNGKYTP